MLFQKGNTFGRLLKGRKKTKEHRRKISEALKGENNGNWLGDKVGYEGVHMWIKRNVGKAKVCSKCGSTKFVEWANKDHTYKRKPEDYIPLCRSCHMKYDISKGQRIFILNNQELWKKQQA